MVSITFILSIIYRTAIRIPLNYIADSLFASIDLYRSVLGSIWPGNCIFYQFVSKLSAILNLTHYLIFPAHLECSSAFGRANSPQFRVNLSLGRTFLTLWSMGKFEVSSTAL